MAKVKDIQKIYESSILQLNEDDVVRYKKATAKFDKSWSSFYKQYMKALGSWVNNKPGYDKLVKLREKIFADFTEMDSSIEKHAELVKSIKKEK